MRATQLGSVKVHRELQVADQGAWLFEVLRDHRWHAVELAIPLQGRLTLQELESLAALLRGEAGHVEDKEAECIGLAEDFDAILHAVIASADAGNFHPSDLIRTAEAIFRFRNEQIAQIVSDEYRRRRERILARCRPESIVQPPKPIQDDLGVGL